MKWNQKPPRFRMRRPKLWLLPILLPLLASCATTGGPATKPVVNDNGCSWAKPIYVSKADVLTDGTARQIKDHDESGARICGWKPKAKQP